MKPSSAIKTDLFADKHHRTKINALGDPLAKIESYIGFAAMAAEVDSIAPRPVSSQGGSPPYPTETMVRIMVLKRLYNIKGHRRNLNEETRFGYKLSINVKKKYKIIRKIETDTANTSLDVYADRGHPSAAREAWLKGNSLRSQTQRKGHRNKPLSDCQQRRHKRIARTRARVEHVFAAIDQMGGKLLHTIG